MIIGEVIGWFHFTARAERRHTVGLAAVSKQTRAASDKVKISSTATIVVLPTTTPVDMQTPAAKLAQSAAVQETAAAVRAATAFQTVSVRIQFPNAVRISLGTNERAYFLHSYELSHGNELMPHLTVSENCRFYAVCESDSSVSLACQ